MAADSTPSRHSGWWTTVLIYSIAPVGLLAPLLLLLGWLLSWPGPVLIGAGAVTALIWGGGAILLGPVSRRIDRQQRAQIPTEVAKLPALAAQHGLSYVESSEELARTLGYYYAPGGRCTHVVRGRLGPRPMAIAWYGYTRGGKALESLVLVIALPAAMPSLSVQATTAEELAPGLRRDKVHFEDDNFNNQYVVNPVDRSPESKRYAVDLLTQQGIDALLSVDSFFFDVDHEVILSEGGSVLTAAQYDRLLTRAGVLARLVDAVPDFVWTQYGTPPRRLPGLAADA